MPHRETSVAIQQANINQDTTHLALNATQGHKRSYTTSYQFSALNATQGHKPSFSTSYISIPIDGDNPTGFHQHRVSIPSKCHTMTHAYSYQQAVYINSKWWGWSDLCYPNKISGLLSRSKQFGVNIKTEVYFFSSDYNWVINSVIKGTVKEKWKGV